MCNVQDLLNEDPCLVAYPPFITRVVLAQALCSMATHGFGPTPPASTPSWVNPDVGGAPIFNPDASGVVTNPDV